MREHAGDVFVVHEPVRNLAAVLGRDQDVEIADGIAPAPVAAGDDDFAVEAFLEQRNQRFGFVLRD